MDPTKFNIRCKEINKKARLNYNGQRYRLIPSRDIDDQRI